VGQRSPFKLGGARLAERTRAPVVPIAHNAGLFWPAKQLFFVRSGTVEVLIGTPIESAEMNAAQINQQAETWINRATEKLVQEAQLG